MKKLYRLPAVLFVVQAGYDVWGCYLSPVNDAYGKPGLAPVKDRVAMCQLAAQDSDKIMVDAWEASQPGYTRTWKVRYKTDTASCFM